MIARWLIIGFVLLAIITATFRFAPDGVFVAHASGVTWMFLIMPLAMFALTWIVLLVFRVNPSDRGEAAAIFALPGLLFGIYEINSFTFVFPNLAADVQPQFASLVFACYAAVIFAGLTASRLRQVTDKDVAD